jgi:hypothetical protein
VGQVSFEDTEWFVVLETGQHERLSFFDSKDATVIGNIHLEKIDDQ